jgi:hypothetical protein
MLLSELNQGMRFMFADRLTPIALAQSKGQHPTTGVFIYINSDERGYPKLKHIDSGKEITAIPVTAYRSIYTNV